MIREEVSKKESDARKKKIRVAVIMGVLLVASMCIPIMKTAKTGKGIEMVRITQFDSIELKNIMYANGWQFPVFAMKQQSGDKEYYGSVYKNGDIKDRDGYKVRLEIGKANSLSHESRTQVACFVWGLICRNSDNVDNLETDRIINIPAGTRIKVYTGGCSDADYEKSKTKRYQEPDRYQDALDYYLGEGFTGYSMAGTHVDCGDGQYEMIDAKDLAGNLTSILEKNNMTANKLK